MTEFVEYAAIGILRRIESNRALIDKWNGTLRTVQSGQGGGIILQLPKPE